MHHDSHYQAATQKPLRHDWDSRGETDSRQRSWQRGYFVVKAPLKRGWPEHRKIRALKRQLPNPFSLGGWNLPLDARKARQELRRQITERRRRLEDGNRSLWLRCLHGGSRVI
ncbi:hypothetical protein [Klebsiella phage vB_KshKPC-M]|nr:hypothetical protein [Klebsiella phage vB_KshKPC-M]